MIKKFNKHQNKLKARFLFFHKTVRGFAIFNVIFAQLFLVGLFVFPDMATAAFAATITSTATGGAWATGNTWVGGVVPLATDTVVIATTGVNKVSTAGNQTCAGLTINAGANLDISANNNILTVNGDVAGTGTLTQSGNPVTITFTGNWTFSGISSNNNRLNITANGSGAQSMSGTLNKFNALTVNKSGGTLSINGAVTTNGAFTMTAGTFNPNTNLVTIGGTLSINGGTMMVGTATWAGNYSKTDTTPAAGSTIEYTNANPTINVAITYQNLVFSGTGTASASNTPLIIQGDLTNTGGGTLNFGARNVTLSGTVSANSIAGYTTTGLTQMTKTNGTTATFTGNVNGGALTINGSGGTLNLGIGLTHTFTGTWTRTAGILNGGSSTLKLGSGFSGTGGTFTANTGTVEWNKAGAQTVAVVTYNNLILSGSGVKTLTSVSTINGNLTLSGTASATAAAALTINGNFTIGSGTTFSGSTFTHNLKGNWSNSGTFNTNTSTFNLNGTSAQTMSGATTFYNLTLNNSNGLNINNDETINHILTLTSGNITTSGNTVIIGASGSVTRTSGHIIGNLQKNVATGATSRTFEVGTASNYNPVTVTFGNVTFAGNLTAKVTSGDHSNIASSALNSSKSVNAYWTLTNAGIVFTNYGATYNFVAGDIDSGANTVNFVVGKYDASTWTYPTLGVRGATLIIASGMTSFSDFAVGEPNNAPTVTVISPNGGEKWKGTQTITWTANDSDGDTLTITIQKSTDGVDWTDIATGEANDGSFSWDTTATADGNNYQIRAIASDGQLAGQDDSDAVFTVDNTAPIVLITNQPADFINTIDITIEFTVDDESAIVTCKLDEGEFAACSSPHELFDLAESLHTFVVRAIDGVGNSGNDFASFTVDLTPPLLTIDSPIITNNPSPTITGVSDDLADVLIIVNGTSYTATPGDGFWSVNVMDVLPDGGYGIQASSIDAAGNPGTAEEGQLTIDTQAPSLFVNMPIPHSQTGNAEISGTTDFEATITIIIDGNPYPDPIIVSEDGSWSVNVGPLGEGSYLVVIIATDELGNTAEQGTELIVDMTPPIITLNGDAIINLIVGGTYEELGATADDNVDGDISGNIIVVGGDAVDTSTIGTHTITYNVSDAAGNPAEEVTRTVIVLPPDTTAPTVTTLGTGTSDYQLPLLREDPILFGATLIFSEEISAIGKTAVENFLTAGADKTLTYRWGSGEISNKLRFSVIESETAIFANDIVATVSDVAGNTAELLLINSLADTQTTPVTAEDGSGIATIDSTTPEVVIIDPNQPVTVTISSGTTNPTIDVSSFIADGTGTLPAITITSADANNANVAIPASTIVTSADSAWNGIIAAPTVTTVTLPETSGQTKTLSTAIEVGFTGAKLSFDKAVRILFPGEAGKRVGYVRTGITFTEITGTCATDNQATGDALAVDGDCKIDVGSDLVIWTKHFTSFAIYTQTTNSTSGGESTGGGGGYGGYAFVHFPSSTIDGTVIATPDNGGETALFMDGGDKVKLAVPPGAVSQNITFTITPTMPGTFDEPDPTKGLIKIGNNIYEISALANDGPVTSFNGNLTITFSYSDDDVVGLDEAALNIYWWDTTTGQWVALDSRVDETRNEVTVSVNHLTIFALLILNTNLTPLSVPTSIKEEVQSEIPQLQPSAEEEAVTEEITEATEEVAGEVVVVVPQPEEESVTETLTPPQEEQVSESIITLQQEESASRGLNLLAAVGTIFKGAAQSIYGVFRGISSWFYSMR